MADGGNLPIKARIICPFYLRHTNERRVIVCEGMAPGLQSAMLFRSRRDMERYSEKYCETYHYNRCPMARAVALKIEQQENELIRSRRGR